MKKLMFFVLAVLFSGHIFAQSSGWGFVGVSSSNTGYLLTTFASWGPATQNGVVLKVSAQATAPAEFQVKIAGFDITKSVDQGIEFFITVPNSTRQLEIKTISGYPYIQIAPQDPYLYGGLAPGYNASAWVCKIP